MKRALRRLRNMAHLLHDAWRGGAAGKRLLLALLALFILSALAVSVATAAHGLVYTLF